MILFGYDKGTLNGISITENLLKFWFETNDLKEVVKKREIWFKSEHAFDAAIRDHF